MCLLLVLCGISPGYSQLTKKRHTSTRTQLSNNSQKGTHSHTKLGVTLTALSASSLECAFTPILSLSLALWGPRRPPAKPRTSCLSSPPPDIVLGTVHGSVSPKQRVMRATKPGGDGRRRRPDAHTPFTHEPAHEPGPATHKGPCARAPALSLGSHTWFASVVARPCDWRLAEPVGPLRHGALLHLRVHAAALLVLHRGHHLFFRTARAD